jgi:hypothetical protein
MASSSTTKTRFRSGKQATSMLKKTRLGSNAMRQSFGGSRTMALIHVKRGGNGPIGNISTCPLAACAARFLAVLLDLPEPVGGTPSTATYSGLPVPRGPAILSPWWPGGQ